MEFACHFGQSRPVRDVRGRSGCPTRSASGIVRHSVTPPRWLAGLTLAVKQQSWQ
jgi:hypothetical protein